MARKRDWNALSKAYQSRLLRGGITKQAYESGASLSAARGHAHTPEHPEDITRKKNQTKYRLYVDKLKKLQQQVIERKEAVWGNRHKYNNKRAKENVLRGVHPTYGKPGIRTLQKMLNESDEKWEYYVVQAGHGTDEAIEDDWGALLYH
jgi:hypothetical protein